MRVEVSDGAVYSGVESRVIETLWDEQLGEEAAGQNYRRYHRTHIR